MRSALSSSMMRCSSAAGCGAVLPAVVRCATRMATPPTASHPSTSPPATPSPLSPSGRPQKVVYRKAPVRSRIEVWKEFAWSIATPRRDPVYYTNNGFTDPLALLVSSGRGDREYARLKMLCCVTSSATIGTWLYGVYFPEKMKQYKDEPWSPFDN